MDWLPHGWLTNLEFYLFHPTDFVSVSKKDSANVSLKFSGATELCPHKALGNKLSENSMFVRTIEMKLSHSVRYNFLIKSSTKYDRCFYDIRNFLISEIFWYQKLKFSSSGILLEDLGFPYRFQVFWPQCKRWWNHIVSTIPENHRVLLCRIKFA